MGRVAKVKKAETDQRDFRGLMQVIDSFSIKRVMFDMLKNGDLNGWDNPSKENSFKSKMTAEKDAKKKAVYCAISENFEDEVVVSEVE